jgi:hypothetical protein
VARPDLLGPDDLLGGDAENGPEAGVLPLADRSEVVAVRPEAVEDGPDLPDRPGLDGLVLLVLADRLEKVAVLQRRRQPGPGLQYMKEIKEELMRPSIADNKKADIANARRTPL